MIIQILKKNPEARTQPDLISLLPLVRENKFFAKHHIQGKNLNEACELLQYYGFFPKGAQIVRPSTSGSSPAKSIQLNFNMSKQLEMIIRC